MYPSILPNSQAGNEQDRRKNACVKGEGEMGKQIISFFMHFYKHSHSTLNSFQVCVLLRLGVIRTSTGRQHLDSKFCFRPVQACEPSFLIPVFVRVCPWSVQSTAAWLAFQRTVVFRRIDVGSTCNSGWTRGISFQTLTAVQGGGFESKF